MNLAKRLKLLKRLRAYLLSDDQVLQAVMHRTEQHNGWLTVENCQQAVRAIATRLLEPEALRQWAKHYHFFKKPEFPKTVAIIMAGNIPLVGFHDMLAVFISGHQCLIKLSEKDRYLLPHIVQQMKQWEPEAASCFRIVEKLTDFDAVIATGSNNTARYFYQYFGNYPHIIRKNRHAVGILTGQESDEELSALSEDVFSYFGLGCRNVSKIYVPEGYDFTNLLEVFHEKKHLVLNGKYKNNFDYNYALLLLNKAQFMANGCIILLENPQISSRIATLHYEFYKKTVNLLEPLRAHTAEIQCVVSQYPLDESLPVIPFGKAQQPTLTDYADGVDTMQFLAAL